MRIEIDRDRLRLPAFVTAHSHAFQRAMRGRAQRASPAGTDDFWSWRTAMFDAAGALDPESIHAVSLVAFRELARAGVGMVGEFHYVHHQPDGTPYDDRTVLAEAVVRAAREAGLRICLLRTVYHRNRPGVPAEGAQRRFCDAKLDDALADVEALVAKFRGDPHVKIGLAPHSVRAVPPSWLDDCARFAFARCLPVHMHVAEQPAEVEACIAETGKRPVELLADKGVLDERFAAVHATHLAPHEPKLLGDAGAFAVLCPTTERDLGDGLPDVGALRAAKVRLCNGVDSHVVVDPFEDMRGVELGERLRTRTRVTDRDAHLPAEALWRMASVVGAQALGFSEVGAHVEIRRDHPLLALVDDEHLLDALVFSGAPSLVDRLVVA